MEFDVLDAHHADTTLAAWKGHLRALEPCCVDGILTESEIMSSGGAELHHETPQAKIALRFQKRIRDKWNISPNGSP
jgi:hypothetical protein